MARVDDKITCSCLLLITLCLRFYKTLRWEAREEQKTKVFSEKPIQRLAQVFAEYKTIDWLRITFMSWKNYDKNTDRLSITLQNGKTDQHEERTRILQDIDELNKKWSIGKHFFDDLWYTIIFMMGQYVIPMLIGYILFPNYLPQSILEFMRTSSSISDIQLKLMFLLTLLIPMKVRDCFIPTKQMTVIIFFNCWFHLEMTTINLKNFKREDITPRIFFNLTMLLFFINKSHGFTKSSYKSTFYIQLLIIYSYCSGELNATQDLSALSAVSFIACVLLVMYLDDRITEWYTRDSAWTPLWLVPPSRTYHAWCWDLQTSFDLEFIEQDDQKRVLSRKIHEESAHLWAIVILIMNLAFVLKDCQHKQKILRKLEKQGLFLSNLKEKTNFNVREWLDTLPDAQTTIFQAVGHLHLNLFVLVWCCVEVICKSDFQIRTMRVLFGIKDNTLVNWWSTSEVMFNCSFV
jgi:hypothetical protein